MPKSPESYINDVVTPAITAGAYSDGDTLGDEMTFVGAANSAHVGGVNISGRIHDDIGQDATIDLFLFSQSVTPAADNAAFVISPADMRFCVGVLRFSTYISAGTASFSEVTNQGRVVKSDGSGNLYGVMKLNGSTPTYAAVDDLGVAVGVLQD